MRRPRTTRAPQNGYVEVARVRGIPIRLHWTVPLGALLPAVLIGFKPLQSFYLCIGYLLLVGIHELGHAIAAKALRLDVVGVDITGFGGMCLVERPKSLASAFLVYSGGLAAQALVLIATGVAIALFGRPSTLFLNCIVFMFTVFNLILFLGNVIPMRGSGQANDGRMLWDIIGEMRRRQSP